MGPPSKRKAKRRSRNWSTQLGFLFFTTLLLSLTVQRNIVNADAAEDAERLDSSSTAAPNTTTTTNGLNNLTLFGENSFTFSSWGFRLRSVPLRKMIYVEAFVIRTLSFRGKMKADFCFERCNLLEALVRWRSCINQFGFCNTNV